MCWWLSRWDFPPKNQRCNFTRLYSRACLPANKRTESSEQASQLLAQHSTFSSFSFFASFSLVFIFSPPSLHVMAFNISWSFTYLYCTHRWRLETDQTRFLPAFFHSNFFFSFIQRHTSPPSSSLPINVATSIRVCPVRRACTWMVCRKKKEKLLSRIFWKCNFHSLAQSNCLLCHALQIKLCSSSSFSSSPSFALNC